MMSRFGECEDRVGGLVGGSGDGSAELRETSRLVTGGYHLVSSSFSRVEVCKVQGLEQARMPCLRKP